MFFSTIEQYSDIGGLDKQIQELAEIFIVLNMTNCLNNNPKLSRYETYAWRLPDQLAN